VNELTGIRSFGIVREAGAAINEIAQEMLADAANLVVEQEPQITDRLLGRLERQLKEYKKNGVQWILKTFTEHGPNAQEPRTGADVAGILDVELGNYRIKKGFLAQAKIAPDRGFTRGEFTRLHGQCRTMLQITPDSYVLIYFETAIRVFPAVSVLATQDRRLSDIYSRSLGRFFEEHFKSFIGDARLATIQGVLQMADGQQPPAQFFLETSARVAFYMKVRVG